MDKSGLNLAKSGLNLNKSGFRVLYIKYYKQHKLFIDKINKTFIEKTKNKKLP